MKDSKPFFSILTYHLVQLYMSPVETWCHNINYYIPDDEDATKEFSTENMTRIRTYDE